MPAAEWAPWAAFPPSTLSHHGAECCDTARAWFLAMDRSFWNGQGGPGWIALRFPWGPTRWPLHWCEAMERDELDCGAHSALALEAFRARGVPAVTVQLVQRQEPHHVAHWHERWSVGGGSPGWAQGSAGYHEACGVVRDGRIEVWDSTVNAWLSPAHVRGVRSVAAVRVPPHAGLVEPVSWRGLRLPPGEWVVPGEPRADEAPARNDAGPRAARPRRRRTLAAGD